MWYCFSFHNLNPLRTATKWGLRGGNVCCARDCVCTHFAVCRSMCGYTYLFVNTHNTLQPSNWQRRCFPGCCKQHCTYADTSPSVRFFLLPLPNCVALIGCSPPQCPLWILGELLLLLTKLLPGQGSMTWDAAAVSVSWPAGARLSAEAKCIHTLLQWALPVWGLHVCILEYYWFIGWRFQKWRTKTENHLLSSICVLIYD